MNKIAYNHYGKSTPQQLPLFIENLPGIGNIEVLTTTQPPKKDVFYLDDHFVLSQDGRLNPRYFPTVHKNYANVFDVIREIYPQEMLPSDSKLYAIANGELWEGKTKKAKHFEDLGDFVDYIQSTKNEEGATIISFGWRDFDAFTTIVELSGSELWGISESVRDDILYRAHIYGKPFKPAPPKYMREK